MAAIVLLLALAATTAAHAHSAVRVEDGVYSRINVHLDDSLPRHQCAEIVDKLKDLLDSTSRGLHSVTNERALFGHVSIVLPESWRDVDCGAEVIEAGDVGAEADLLVSGGRHPVFGSKPFAEQFGQCGVQAKTVNLPYTGLMKADEDSSRQLLAEWIKARFGVFEESGFEGDSLYPASLFEGPAEVENRGCPNSTEVICSLDDYDHDATTKQNILCDGLSSRQVMLASADLAADEETGTNKTASAVAGSDSNSTADFLAHLSRKAFSAPTFRVVRPKTSLFVLVLDRTAGSFGDSAQSNWEVLQQALFHFIAKLPTGAQMSIVSFGNAMGNFSSDESDAVVNLPPTTLTERNRDSLHGRIPRRPNAEEGSEGKACVDCALKMAVKLIQGNFSGKIVLVTKATATSRVPQAETFALVEKHVVPVYSLQIPATSYSEAFVQLSAYGANFVVSADRSRPQLMTGLSKALTSVLARTATSRAETYSTFHRDERVPDVDNTVSGNFVVEEHLRKNLWVVVTANDERDIESVEVLSPTGKRHAFPNFEQGAAYFHLTDSNEPGIWTYTVRLYPSVATSYPLHIEALAQPADADAAIVLSAWTSANGATAGNEIIVYAQVSEGELPVMDAKVTAFITRPRGDDSAEPVKVQLELKDAGTGYPDITRGDGIYSAYFADFSPVSGHYQISVVASHNGGSARTPKLGVAGSAVETSSSPCCGSSFPAAAYTIPTGPFQRYVAASSFYVEQSANFYVRQGARLVNDVFPPSRITDFRVDDYMNASLFVTLSWTSPGGDLDVGKAFRYEIRCYTNREALRDANFAQLSIPVHASLVPSPEEAGREQRCTVGVPWPNEVFYYAIVAFDEAGNRGKISNTVAVFIREEPVTEEAPIDNEIADGGDLSRQPLLHGGVSSQQEVTYIAVGVVAAVFVLVVLATVAAIRRYYRFIASGSSPSKDDPETGSSSSDDNATLSSTLRRILPGLCERQHGLWQSEAGTLEKVPAACHQPSVVSVEAASWGYRNGMQKATSQEPPGVHKILMTSSGDDMVSREYMAQVVGPHGHSDCVSASAATHSTDCSAYESSSSSTTSSSSLRHGRVGNKDDLEPESPSLPSTCQMFPRISIMEDFSVYRDLSHMSASQQDYFSFSHLPAELLHVKAAATAGSRPQKAFFEGASPQKGGRRHESLV